MKVVTTKKQEVLDITDQIEVTLKGSGLVNVFVKHTTAAITIADLDPGTDRDYLAALEVMTPNEKWRHPHDPSHFPDHLWPSIIGVSLTLPYKGSRLVLGAWQRVVLIEFDGPRERELEITCVKAD